MALSRGRNAASWVLRLLGAGILLQRLFFRFRGAEESVYIFSRLGMEPWGRIGSGVAELAAGLLLLLPSLAAYGALLALMVILGAIVSHLAVLGIEILGDGGLLFFLALTVFFGSLGILARRAVQLDRLGFRARLTGYAIHG